MDKSFEHLLFVHSYLDGTHNTISRAISISREEAIKVLNRHVDLQNQAPEEQRLIPYFAQFLISAWALNKALGVREVSEMGDWISWALSESITDDHVQTLHIVRLVGFLESPVISSWPGFMPTLVVYLSAFYYYARCRTAMKEVGEEFWQIAERTFKSLMKQPADLIEIEEAFLGVNTRTRTRRRT